MNIGVSSGCFYPDKTLDCLKKVALTGAKTTEIFFNTDSELDENYLYELKRTADEKGDTDNFCASFYICHRNIYVFCSQ